MLLRTGLCLMAGLCAFVQNAHADVPLPPAPQLDLPIEPTPAGQGTTRTLPSTQAPALSIPSNVPYHANPSVITPTPIPHHAQPYPVYEGYSSGAPQYSPQQQYYHSYPSAPSQYSHYPYQRALLPDPPLTSPPQFTDPPVQVGPSTAGGLHDRYPYYSYRRPWYTPGPASLNVTIVW